MTIGGGWTAESVRQAFSEARRVRPAYAAMLPFFGEIYALQESAAESARPAAIHIREELLPAKMENGLPLIDRAQFTIDWEQSRDLLRRCCDLAREATPELGSAAAILLDELASPETHLRPAALALAANDSGDLEKEASEVKISGSVFAFFLYNAIWPGIAHHVRRHRPDATPSGEWSRGYCPVCGAVPFLSLLDLEGRRSAVCSFCRHEWSLRRVFCPFCETSDSAHLDYFFSEEEKEYRVHTCKSCGKYVKTVDLRALERPCYPPLEALISAHLDIQAREQGFQSLTPSWLSL